MDNVICSECGTEYNRERGDCPICADIEKLPDWEKEEFLSDD